MSMDVGPIRAEVSRSGLGNASDHDLLVLSRLGDGEAYAELFRRHRAAAERVARALTRSAADAQDLVAEAFTRVYGLLQRGKGPTEAFRPYLLATVRNARTDAIRRKSASDVLTDDVGESVNVRMLDLSDSHGDRSLVLTAFQNLPERWQAVLWHLEIEGQSAAEIAPMMGMSANAVSALGYRAREGLRQEFLAAHLHRSSNEQCYECRQQLGAYVRDRLNPREVASVDRHLDRCEDCAALLPMLHEVNNVFQASAVPALTGVSLAAYLGGHGPSWLLGVFRSLRHAPRRPSGRAAAATAAACAVIVAAGVVAAGRDDRTGEAASLPSVPESTAGQALTAPATTAALAPSSSGGTQAAPAPASAPPTAVIETTTVPETTTTTVPETTTTTVPETTTTTVPETTTTTVPETTTTTVAPCVPGPGKSCR